MIQKTSGDFWNTKQEAAKLTGARYYGDGGTIHASGDLDVEVTEDGEVVAVWFRCQPLPFNARRVRSVRADEMRQMYTGHVPTMTGVEVVD